MATNSYRSIFSNISTFNKPRKYLMVQYNWIWCGFAYNGVIDGVRADRLWAVLMPVFMPTPSVTDEQLALALLKEIAEEEAEAELVRKELAIEEFFGRIPDILQG
jgi:hypothetical protein